MTACPTPTSFVTPLRFRCVPGCGRCCSYRVAVLAGETEFLRKYGAAVEPPDQASGDAGADTGGYLRRENSRCVFQNRAERCTIYEDRPVYCRLYPLVRDGYPRRQIDADFSCPGLGQGEPFTEEGYRSVAALEATVAELAAWELRHRRAFQFACETLQHRDAFAPAESMGAAARALVQNALLDGATLDVGERLYQSVEASRPRFLACGNLTDAEQVVRLFGGERTAPAGVVPPGEAAALSNYLSLWTRRNLMVRAAHALTLGSPLPVNVAHAFMELLAKIATELCDAAARSPSADRVNDSVRQLDGSLRSRFMRAAISAPS